MFDSSIELRSAGPFQGLEYECKGIYVKVLQSTGVCQAFLTMLTIVDLRPSYGLALALRTNKYNNTIFLRNNQGRTG